MRGLGPFLRDAWRLSRPYFVQSDERRSAWLLLAAVIALNLAQVGMTVLLNFWNNAFYNTLQNKDFKGFWELLFMYRHTDSGPMPGFCVIAAVYVLIAVYRTYFSQWLRIRWRRWMTERFLANWLQDRAYYRLSLQANVAKAAELGDQGTGTENPDQRIAEDLSNFVTDTLSLSIDLMSNVVTLFSFLTILWTLSGPITLLGVEIPGYMVWVALIYSALGTWVTHLVGRPLAALNFRQQRVEADFRFSLVRLRENVEGIALYGGEAEEHRSLSARFAAVIVNWWQIMQRTKLLNALVSSYTQIAIIFPIVVAAPRFFSGAMTLGDLTQTADAFGQVQGAMSWIVNSYSSLAGWRATVERLATFHRAIEATRAAGPGFVTETGSSYGLHDASLALPSGQPLLDGANLVFTSGQSVVISGRSGSGKSTLFRALAGIWPFGHGTLERPAGTILFLPQRPYLPLGTLRHVVCYPGKIGDFSDEAVLAALTEAGLAALAPRLDEEDNWAQRLSGGEQQRLALARALLARPEWLFLDEATASLDPEAETALYATLKRNLPHTTIISIAHRPTVADQHARHVVFDRPGEGPGQLRELRSDPIPKVVPSA